MGPRATILATVLMLAGVATAQTHAPWPTDWNNWNDPGVWCSVGDPGNAGDQSRLGMVGDPTYYGGVSYTYNIGKFEVTAGQYTTFLNAVAASDPYGLYNPLMANTSNPLYNLGRGAGCNILRGGSAGSYTYSVASDYANRPVNWVSWGDAARYVNWVNNGQPGRGAGSGATETGVYALNGATTDAQLMAVQTPDAATRAAWASGTVRHWLLPTDNEWYKAAYYKGGSTNAGYWTLPTRTSSYLGSDMTEATNSGSNVNFHNSAWPIDSGKYYTTVVGEFQNTTSPYGAFDLGGNVFEWNDTNFSGYRGFRGGAFDGDMNYLRPWDSLATNPSYEQCDYGFRLVEVPEPATLALLALGGLAVIRKRRK